MQQPSKKIWKVYYSKYAHGLLQQGLRFRRDVLIRDEAANTKAQEDYINFLRGIFKGTEPTKYIQLAYLTGILPIKKEKTQSALNNFKDYSMLKAGPLASYVGFTEDEVHTLGERGTSKTLRR